METKKSMPVSWEYDLHQLSPILTLHSMFQMKIKISYNHPVVINIRSRMFPWSGHLRSFAICDRPVDPLRATVQSLTYAI